MAILVIGSTGGVGSRVVKQLVKSNSAQEIRVLCRSKASVPEEIKEHERVKVIEAGILKLKQDEMKELLNGCETVISCLGHNIKKMFFPPYNICQAAVEKVIEAARAENQKLKIIAINTVGVGHPDGSDRHIRGFMENRVLGALWVMLPPHRDNYRLSHYLYKKIGKEDELISWCAVRPDGLTNDDSDTEYEVYPNLQTNLFNAKITSRLNAAKFMVDIATNEESWNRWKNSYPVVLNAGQLKNKSTKQDNPEIAAKI